MKKNAYKTFAYLMFYCLLCSCTKRQRLINDFKVVNINTMVLLGAGEKDRIHKVKAEMILGAEAFLKFNDDGTVNALNAEGIFGKGTWQLENEETLKMDWTLPKLPSIQFDIKEEKDPETGGYYLSLKSKPIEKWELSLLLKHDSFFNNGEVDLISESYNWWRIRPVHKESEEEIKKRLLAQLEFMIQYFKMVSDKELGEFSIAHLQSPIMFYANGIGLEEDNTNLLVTYYDENDASIAKRLLINGISSLSVYPKDDKSYTKGYYNALKEIKKTISLM